MPEEDVPAKTVNFITKNTEIMLKKIDSSKKVQAWERVAKQAGGLLMQQENLFDDTHLKVIPASKLAGDNSKIQKLSVLQTCSEVSAILNHYTDAAEYAERVLEAFKKIYPPVSSQIAMQEGLKIQTDTMTKLKFSVILSETLISHIDLEYTCGIYKGLKMQSKCLEPRWNS